MQPGQPEPFDRHDAPQGPSGAPGPAWVRPPVPEQRPHRVSARTILLPLSAILLHLITMTFTSAVYMMVLVFFDGFSGGGILPGNLQDPDAISQILQRHYPIIAVLYSLLLIPIYALWLAFSRRRDPRVLLMNRTRPSSVLAGLAMMVGALGLTNLFFALLEWIGTHSAFVSRQLEDYKRIAGSFTPESGIVWLILGICIMAPLTEELLFRGIVQGEFRRVMPEPVAIVLQAVLFAAYHMQPVQSAYALIPGLLLGMAYAWTRNIWVPILMHMTFNFLGSVVPVLNGEDAGLGQIAALAQLGFIVVGALAAIYLHLSRRLEPSAADSGTDRSEKL